MDSLSIATSALTLLGVCGAIIKVIEGRRDVDQNLAILYIEINELSKVLKSLETMAKNPSLNVEIVATRSGDKQELWEMVDQSMSDCRDTLNSLAKILASVRCAMVPKITLFPIRTIQSSIKTGDITLHKKQIKTYIRTIKFSLQLITGYVPLSMGFFMTYATTYADHPFAAVKTIVPSLSKNPIIWTELYQHPYNPVELRRHRKGVLLRTTLSPIKN
jgi:hypothetical protein